MSELLFKGKPYCRSGHKLTEESIIIRPNGKKECAICARAVRLRRTLRKMDNALAAREEVVKDFPCPENARLILLQRPAGKNLVAIVDEDDYDALKYDVWFSRNGYATRCRKIDEPETPKRPTMHRIIAAPPDDMFVDHKNGNPLDNRRCNLRICTKAQNQQNQSIRRSNKSGYKGVNYVRSKGKYRAEIRANNQKRHIGYFSDARQAAQAYNAAAIELHGEFANLNIIEEV